MASRRRVRKGFTLIELLVVISIIGILVGLLLPAINSAREAGRRAKCQSNMRNVVLAIMGYVNNKNVFPPSGEFGEDPHQGDLVRGVETGRRFVGEQQRCILRQRAGNQHARLFATGEFRRRPVAKRLDFHAPHGAVDHLDVFGT